MPKPTKEHIDYVNKRLAEDFDRHVFGPLGLGRTADMDDDEKFLARISELIDSADKSAAVTLAKADFERLLAMARAEALNAPVEE
jgi:hypothetical protein